MASLALALREHGVDGSIVTLNYDFQKPDVILPDRDDFHGIPIQRIPFRGSTRYPLAPSVLTKLGEADIIHVHAIDFFFDFLAATRMVHRKPLFASTHGGFFHTKFASRLKNAYFRTVTRTSARAYTQIIGSSENDAETFRRIAPRNTIAIENGVDVEKWRDSGSREPTKTLLTLGRFSSNKALPDLIALIAELGAPWRLLIAGMESDLTAADLRSAAQAQGVEDRVEIHVGLDSAGIRKLSARSSYVASASGFEGFGLTAIEGLSAGLVPILNDIAPFRRVVQQSQCGFITDMSDTANTATKLREFHLSHIERYADQRTAAIEASKPYSWPGVAARFAQQYEAALTA